MLQIDIIALCSLEEQSYELFEYNAQNHFVSCTFVRPKKGIAKTDNAFYINL